MADTSRHRALSAVSRVRMLRLLRQSPVALTADALAEATGLHPSTVRAHLDQLTASGLLTRFRQADGSPGRPAWRYQATPQPQEPADAAADRPYQQLAAALIGQLARTEDDPHGAGVRAGRDWGRALASQLGRVPAAGGLVRVLDQLGFAPRIARRDRTGRTVLELRSCPYLELATTHPDVVCGLHLGVINGALGALGAARPNVELEPFARPDACLVRFQASDRATGNPVTSTPRRCR